MRLFTPPRRAQALHAAGATGGGGTSTRGFPCGWGRSPSTRSSLFITTCWSITHYSLRLQASKRGSVNGVSSHLPSVNRPPSVAGLAGGAARRCRLWGALWQCTVEVSA